jgi:hypothetical protein
LETTDAGNLTTAYTGNLSIADTGNLTVTDTGNLSVADTGNLTTADTGNECERTRSRKISSSMCKALFETFCMLKRIVALCVQILAFSLLSLCAAWCIY